MPSIAPRFTPTGVRVGDMPTPQVRPKLGTAQGIAAIGDTIQSLGQTAERVQDRREAELQANTAAGMYAAQEEASILDAMYKEYLTKAKGVKAAQAYTDFKKAVAERPKPELSPGAMQEFERRNAMTVRGVFAAAQMHASNEDTAYKVDVYKKDMGSGVDTAALSLARNDKQEARLSIGRAIAAADMYTNLTGMPIDKQAIVEASYTQALSEIAKTGSAESAVEFYTSNKGSFGRMEAKASAIAAASMDTVAVDTHVRLALSDGVEDGGLSLPKIMRNLDDKAQAPQGKYGLVLDEQRKARAEEAVKRAVALDVQERKQFADQQFAYINAASLRGMGAYATAITEVMESSQRMLPQDREVLLAKHRAGPNSSPQDQYEFKARIKTARTQQDLLSLEGDLSRFVLSEKDRTAASLEIKDALQNFESHDTKMKEAVIKELERDREFVYPKATREHTLSADELKTLKQVDDITNYVLKTIGPKDASPDAIQKAVIMARAKVTAINQKGEAVDTIMAGMTPELRASTDQWIDRQKATAAEKEARDNAPEPELNVFDPMYNRDWLTYNVFMQ